MTMSLCQYAELKVEHLWKNKKIQIKKKQIYEEPISITTKAPDNCCRNDSTRLGTNQSSPRNRQ